MAVVLREVKHSDFKNIQNLFFEVYGKNASLGFEKAFFKHEQLLGFCLHDDDSIASEIIVGYFGCFTYKRNIGGIDYQFYNTHTWIVQPDYRKHSLKLLLPFLRLNDGIITNFSANGKVAQILEQLKFSKYSIVNNVLIQSFSWKSYHDQRKINAQILKQDIAIWHKAYECLCLNLSLGHSKQSIELILKPVARKPKWVQSINQLSKLIIRKPIITKSYFLYKIHFVSDADLLMKYINALSHYLFLKKRVGGLILPESIIKNLSPNYIKNHYEDEVYVRTNLNHLPPIDYLYSEVFYLNISDK